MHPSSSFLVMRYRFLAVCASVYQCLFRPRQRSPDRDVLSRPIVRPPMGIHRDRNCDRPRHRRTATDIAVICPRSCLRFCPQQLPPDLQDLPRPVAGPGSSFCKNSRPLFTISSLAFSSGRSTFTRFDGNARRLLDTPATLKMCTFVEIAFLQGISYAR